MKKTWKTKEGKILLISEMRTSHIKNCIKMCEKNKYIGIKELNDLLYADYDNMGDYAQIEFDQICNDASDRIPVRELDWLKEELKRRTQKKIIKYYN